MINRVGIRGREVSLYVQFTDAYNEPVDADRIPLVSIYDSHGILRQLPTNIGCGFSGVNGNTHGYDNDDENVGLYVFNYNIPIDGYDGYWVDVWDAYVGGEQIPSAAFQFLVISSGEAVESSEPIYAPGTQTKDGYIVGTGTDEELDFTEMPFKFDKAEMEGVNVILQLVKPRLKNDGVRKVPNGTGGYDTVPCSVFSDSELIAFIVNSLSEFNQIPHFSNFNFGNPQIYTVFADVIVQGAVLLALAAQSLIERGREFVITDNGITYQPPQISEILNTQYNTQLADYTAKVKFIKCNMKPRPLGLGTFRTSSISPAYLRLRHLRERQII